jgi:pimeloyl-ACP methyl ester carboxylesterase
VTDSTMPSRTLTDARPDDAEELRLDRAEGSLSAVRIVARVDRPEEAPVALLVPGYTGSKEDFYPVLGPLADLGFTVLAYSQRGQFDSEGPQGSEPPVNGDGYDLQTLGADVHWVLDALGVQRPVHLLGHSFGGVVGIEAVLRDASRFASFTMWNSGPRGWRGRMDDLDAIESGGSEGLWRKGNPDWDESSSDPVQRWFHDRMLATSSTQLLAAAHILEDQPDRTDELAATGVPLLVSHGDADDAWPQDWQREMAERAGGQYVVIADAGHSAQVDQPEESARVLASFWRTAAGA